jgi:hypothetical protein
MVFEGLIEPGILGEWLAFGDSAQYTVAGDGEHRICIPGRRRRLVGPRGFELRAEADDRGERPRTECGDAHCPWSDDFFRHDFVGLRSNGVFVVS